MGRVFEAHQRAVEEAGTATEAESAFSPQEVALEDLPSEPERSPRAVPASAMGRRPAASAGFLAGASPRAKSLVRPDTRSFAEIIRDIAADEQDLES